MTPRDNRIAARVPTAAEVLVVETGCVEGDRAVLKNLSATGAYVEMETPPDCGASVRVLVGNRREGACVTLPAKVVRVTPSGAGLLLQDLDDDALRFLRQVLQSASHPWIAPTGEPTPAPADVTTPQEPPPAAADDWTSMFHRAIRRLLGRD